ncbi:hypothetical protein ABE583_03855 [Stenotrophomonas sp. TWI143]|uniref:hypothetical protein n=1 Tax=Stenotrophomonas sp. TWI143 TaxID=3136771 RepID=UPI003208D474
MVRAVPILAMMLAAPLAWAEPAAPVQVRLVVVEACQGDAGGRACAVPHQRSDAPQLPAQLRELAPAPAAPTDDASTAPTFIY